MTATVVLTLNVLFTTTGLYRAWEHIACFQWTIFRLAIGGVSVSNLETTWVIVAFRGFIKSIQVNFGTVRHIMPRKHRTTSLEINYSSILPRRCWGFNE